MEIIKIIMKERERFFILIDLQLIMLKHKKLIIKAQIIKLNEDDTPVL
tara:strand:+ start:48 stop:191 length:144 start_codon:yes stop_codon:yes gene_type:complete